jgi:2'-5' RNA ligase
MAKDPLVGRDYIFGWREDYKAEGNKEEGEENLSNLHITLVPPGAYNACKYLGSYWL